MIYLFCILIFFTNNRCIASSTTDIVTRTTIDRIDSNTAQFVIDENQNSSIFYRRGEGFSAKIRDKRTFFVTYELTAAQERRQMFIMHASNLNSHPTSLVGFQIDSKNTSFETCRSYAIFNPSHFNADTTEDECHNFIYFFHFIKNNRNHDGFVIFENNTPLIPRTTIHKLTKACLDSLEVLRATQDSPLFTQISYNQAIDQISDDASTICDDSSSDTDNRNSIYDDTDL